VLKIRCGIKTNYLIFAELRISAAAVAATVPNMWEELARILGMPPSFNLLKV